MTFADFQASMCEMTVAEYGADKLPAGLDDDTRLRVYAGGGAIVAQADGHWCLQLAPGDRYTTARYGVTLAQLERLLWMVTRHGAG